jgi:hypothetical protein
MPTLAGLAEPVAWILSDGAPTEWAGFGSPEGVITSDLGSAYVRLDGALASTFYVKESGSGNTG